MDQITKKTSLRLGNFDPKLWEQGIPEGIPKDAAGRLSRLFWIAFALAAIAAVYSILGARDLVYDGSYYVLSGAARHAFQLFEPARIVSQVLQQCFAVAGARLGVHDFWTLGVLFSLGASGWPLALTALCWFVLPRGEKSWIAGPLLNLVFAIPTTSFIGVGEGIIGSCLLWLTFFLVEFRGTNRAGALGCIAGVAACAFVHEAAILCLLVIAVAALLRLSDTKGFCRAAMFLTVIVSLAGAGDMLRWILVPRSPIERANFLASLMGRFFGNPASPNIPAIASAVAAVAIVAALFAKERRAWAAFRVTAVLLVVLLVLLVADPAYMVAARLFFAARALPVGLTTLLAGFFVMLRQRGETPARFATPPVLAIVLSLAIFQAAAQTVISAEWISYVRALSGLVSTENGIVSYAAAMRRLDPRGTRFRRELLESWSVEPLAILLAPGGHVRTFVEASPVADWVPYDPRKTSRLPRAPGLDWSQFVPRPAP